MATGVLLPLSPPSAAAVSIQVKQRHIRSMQYVQGTTYLVLLLQGWQRVGAHLLCLLVQACHRIGRLAPELSLRGSA